MPTQIKICGLKSPAHVRTAITAGASHIGFVHFAKSPRHVALPEIAALALAAGNAGKVLVCVDPDNDLVAAITATPHIDTIQLHGAEPADRVAEIRERSGKRIWKAISVSTPDDFDTAQKYAGLVDLILFDAKTPKGADLPGGMGLSFDWNMLTTARLPQHWGLSGGLTPENVADAIRIAKPPLVDVSSGVESEPGVKDMDKIAAFCQAVHQF